MVVTYLNTEIHIQYKKHYFHLSHKQKLISSKLLILVIILQENHWNTELLLDLWAPKCTKENALLYSLKYDDTYA